MKIYFIYESELVEDTLNNEASLRNECIEIFFELYNKHKKSYGWTCIYTSSIRQF